MMAVQLGQVVFSRAGRDAGRPFMVIALDEEGYALLSDGALRKMESPKRKKLKHIRPTKELFTNLGEKILGGGLPTDWEVRQALSSLGYYDVDALKEE